MLRISIGLFGWTLLDAAVLVPPESGETEEAGYMPAEAGIAAVIHADDAEVRSAREDRLGFVASRER